MGFGLVFTQRIKDVNVLLPLLLLYSDYENIVTLEVLTVFSQLLQSRIGEKIIDIKGDLRRN